MTYRCREHGVTLEISGERGEIRRVTLPPPATPLNAGSRTAGVPGACALPVTPSARVLAGPLQRRDRHGRTLAGVCHVEAV